MPARGPDPRSTPMVGWYDPAQLARTAVEVLVSTMFGRHADHRVLEAVARRNFDPHDYTEHDDGQKRETIWLDYVGDVGDGWNSTYAVAYALAQPSLALTVGGKTVDAPRGDVLVFGGDQVYPTASNAAYRRRLVAPYETALPHTPSRHPDAFAIPGNHDWYDSLVSFTRQFCSRRWLGGWRTRQTCSYFALKLPQRWWLLGTDVQLGSDVDTAQVEFFREVAARMRPDDGIILCNAEPNWITAAAYEGWDPEASERNLRYLEEKVLGRRVRVFIAGDLHHYRRHENPDDGTQKITCGGGGAFLHPTHGPRVEKITERGLDGRPHRSFRLRASYPSWWTSWGLTWRNLAFPLLNPQLAAFTALVYVVLGWAVIGPIDDFGGGPLGAAAGAIFDSLGHRAGMTLVLVGLLAAVFLFTDTHSKLQRFVGGGLHGLAHLGAMLVSGWAGASLLAAWWPATSHWIGALAGLAVGGAVVAPVLLGLYLLVSLNLFRRHGNEAFSSLRIQDWKSFLRLHIDARGVLTIYPIGIRRVARRWREADHPARSEASQLVPDDRRATPPALIEPPIRLTRDGTAPPPAGP